MARRFGWKATAVISATIAVAASWALPATAQPARARASARVDLDARLREAQASALLTQSLLKTGSRVAAVCANCHGEGGTSLKPDIPNLASQNPAYLLEQLRQFADGRRRNEFMEGMIRAMDSDEKVGMVLFYSSQPLAQRPASSAVLAAAGHDYYGKVCFRCHGTDGRGHTLIPRIAGQQSAYVRTTLQRYRAGTGVRVEPLMSASTRLMTDADIDAVAAYVASMP